MTNTSRRPIAPVPPPLPVGSSATMTIGSRCLPHQANQARFAAVEEARSHLCCTATPTATTTMTAS